MDRDRDRRRDHDRDRDRMDRYSGGRNMRPPSSRRAPDWRR